MIHDKLKKNHLFFEVTTFLRMTKLYAIFVVVQIKQMMDEKMDHSEKWKNDRYLKTNVEPKKVIKKFKQNYIFGDFDIFMLCTVLRCPTSKCIKYHIRKFQSI